jgi:hypothetical protein
MAVLLLLAASLPASAGGTATVSSAGPEGRNQMTAAWADEDTLRLDFAGQPAYMLLLDGEMYAVAMTGGTPMVLPLGAMAGMAQGMAGQGGPLPEGAGRLGARRARSVTAIEDTGETETVAGIEGGVYRISWVGADGASHTDTAVLTDDPLVREFGRAFRAFAEAGSDPVDPRSVRIEDRGLGVLRYGDEFVVREISGATPPAGAFELPAPPLNMQDMMRGMGRTP